MPPSDLFLAQSPPANLQPVDFDFGAAQAAAAALRDAADTVHRAAGTRASNSRDAEGSWTGGQRHTFDKIEHAVAGAASDLVRSLRDAADKLHEQAAAAHAENSRRKVGLDHWQHDLAAARRRYIEAQNQRTK